MQAWLPSQRPENRADETQLPPLSAPHTSGDLCFLPHPLGCDTERFPSTAGWSQMPKLRSITARAGARNRLWGGSTIHIPRLGPRLLGGSL